MPVVLVMDIQKEGKPDTDYTVYLHVGSYVRNGRAMVWGGGKGNHDTVHHMTYVKDKETLQSKSSKTSAGFVYKDGKWTTMPETSFIGVPFIFEPYSDSAFEKGTEGLPGCHQDEVGT